MTTQEQLKVSRHAAIRYCERMGVKNTEAAAKSIIELLKDAEDVEIKPKFQTAELMDHGKKAQFKRSLGLVFVICDNTVLTVHEGSAKRWRKTK